MKKYLICVDSDGCVFDNMELKHKECFCPATVNVWGLQNVSRYARETAEFVNLYSKTRGMNRFPALVRTLELLGKRPEVQQRGWTCPNLNSLKMWIDQTDKLSANALREYVKTHPDPLLEQALHWSDEVDENIARIVHGVTPLPGVKDTFGQINTFAELMIVSATPEEAIVREWDAQGLLPYVERVAGQEQGSKANCIQLGKGDRFQAEQVLMVGDAPGDYAAAEQNGVLFYPILPGQEIESWQRLRQEGLERFRTGTYAGAYMRERLAEFDGILRESPPWNA